MAPVSFTESLYGDACFQTLRDHIVSSTGLSFYAERTQALAGHIANRLRQRGLRDCREYLDLLKDRDAGEEELDRLIELLTIGETYFFRHCELFDALRDVVLPEIITRNRDTRRIRIWSAGCSIGAEAYSLSILLRRELGHLVPGWNISILGTDINRQFLAKAAKGRFEEWAFRGTPQELREECFELEGNKWRIDPRFQEGVAFQYHNLAKHPFPSLVHNLFAFDLIICRNVLIYFGSNFIERFITQVTDCLVADGWLAVGHAEHGPHLHKAFDTVTFPGATLYQTSIHSQSPSESEPSSCTRRSKIAPEAPAELRLRPTVPIRRDPIQKRRPLSPAASSPDIECRAERRPAHNADASPNLEHIRVLADQGDVDAALKRCETLIAEDRLNPIYYFYQALLLDQLTGHDAALGALQRAIYLDRTFALAHYYIGLTQCKRGDALRALKAFRNVLSLLAECDERESLTDAEGLTVAELVQLTRMHMNTLQTA